MPLSPAVRRPVEVRWKHSPSAHRPPPQRGRHMVRILLATAGIAAMAVAPAQAQPASPGEVPQRTPTQGSRTTAYDAAFFAQYAPRTAFDIVQRIPGFQLDLGNSSAASGGRSRLCRHRRQRRHQWRPAEQQVRVARHPAHAHSRQPRDPRRGRPGRPLWRRLFEQESGRSTSSSRQAAASTGNITVSAVAALVRQRSSRSASGTVSFSRGPSTFNIAADTARDRLFSRKASTAVTDVATGELLEFRRKFNSIHQHDPFISGSWAMEKADNDSFHLNAR